MANQKSAYVTATEIDSSGPVTRTPTGTPACVISPTQKGPAFVPTQVTTLSDYESVFGGVNTNTPYGYLTAREWFGNSTVPLVQVRVLGAGDGTSKDGTDGTVSRAGFVVGSQLPVESNAGDLGNNSFANSGGVTGSVYILGCFMSESLNSTVFSEAGLQNSSTAVPIVRGILFAPSGVVLRLSSAAAPSAGPASNFVATETAFSGAFTGSLNLNSGKQEFTLILNGHKGTNSLYPNVITASFDPTLSGSNFFKNIFNTDPLKLQEAGHCLYSSFNIFPNFAVPTGSGVVLVESGSSYGAGIENIAFLVPASGSNALHTSNQFSTKTPNFEGFKDRYGAAFSPWVISQGFGGKAYNLFRFHHLSDGESGNGNVKISIANIQPGTTFQPYGSFDVIVRNIEARDEVGSPTSFIETFTKCNLDPTSPNYVARKIGSIHNYFNFDTDLASQKVVTSGEYPNVSRRVRVEMTDIVDTGEIDPSAIPFGFRGPQHLVTQGSSSLYNIRHGDLLNPSFPYFNTANVGNYPLFKASQPPVPMRMNLKKSANSNGVDANLCWGVHFENEVNISDPNGSAQFNENILGFSKYYPSFSGSSNYVQFSVFDNTGVAPTSDSNILDCDVFNNNLFSLEKVKVVTASNGLPDVSTTALLSWSYVRSGGIPTDNTTKTRALRVSDLVQATVQPLAKFSFYLERGFDGVNIFNADTRYLKNASAAQEIRKTSRGLTNGPTVQSYLKALGIVGDVNDVNMQLLAIPGIRERYITDTAITTVEQDRFDCFYVMDLEQYDTNGDLITGSYTDVSVNQTAANFVARGINSSFAATYFPDVNISGLGRTVYEKVPPSVVAFGAIGKNDSIGQVFNAPAGYSRGTLANVTQFAVPLTKENCDTLYISSINPLISKSGVGPVVWGQKTTLQKESLLNRINVRRLLIAIRREVRQVGNQFLFEPARQETLAAFNAAVQPIMQRYQAAGGVKQYKVAIDTTTTTQADLDNKTIRGKIFLIPTTVLEFLSIDFVVTNRDNFVNG